MSKMDTKQLDRLIELRSKAKAEEMALEMFKEFKEDFLAKFNLDITFETPVPKKPTKSNSSEGRYDINILSSLDSDSRIKQVYDSIKKAGMLDRHQVMDIVQGLNDNEISAGTINGRLGDLLVNNLIKVRGTHKGKFGKQVTLYGIA